MTGMRAAMRLEQIPEPIPILYIDDEPMDHEQVCSALAQAVTNPVHVFTRPRQLYDYLDMHTGPFVVLVDLVLVDTMDTGGGYEIIETLRRRPDITDTDSAIIAVTAMVPNPGEDEALLHERVRKAGADAFIVKPVSSADLAVVLGRPGWFRLEVKRPAAS